MTDEIPQKPPKPPSDDDDGVEEDEEEVPGLAIVDAKIKKLKKKMQSTKSELKKAAKMAIKADMYKAMISALMGEIQTAITLRKKKILQFKYEKQQKDLMAVERMNEDLMSKLGDLKMTRDAITGTLEFTQKSLQHLATGGGNPPKVKVEEGTRVVESVQGHHDGQLHGFKDAQSTTLEGIAAALKDALVDRIGEDELKKIDEAVASGSGSGKVADQKAATDKAEKTLDEVIEKAIKAQLKDKDALKDPSDAGEEKEKFFFF